MNRWVYIALLALPLAATPTLCLAKDWIAGDGNWSNPSNWNPAAVPVAGETVNVTFGDGVARTVTYDYAGVPVSLSSLTVDLIGAGTSATTLTMSNSALTTDVIRIGGTGRGVFKQSGGTHTLNAGDLNLGASELNLGGAGTGMGTYNLSGTGILAAHNDEIVGGDGTGIFNQSGGTNVFGDNPQESHVLYLGFGAGSGTYTLTAGTLSGQYEVIGAGFMGFSGTGSFIQSGGSNSIGSELNLGILGGTGTYTLSGSGVLNVGSLLSVATQGKGDFNQSGGNVTIGSSNNLSLLVGKGDVGTYTMSGGSLTAAGNELIGGLDGLAFTAATGTFSQSGGVSTIAGAHNMVLAASPGSTGTYNLSGGASTIGGNLLVGGSTAAGGAGVATVSGAGVLSVNQLQVFNSPGSSFNLSGGTLNVANINLHATPSLFNWTSGTLNITNDMTWDSAAAANSTSAAFGLSLALSSSKTLQIAGNETIGGVGPFTLSVGNGIHNVSGNITVKPGGTLVGTGVSTLGFVTYASLTQAGGTVSNFRNTGNYNYQSGAITGQFTNDGTITFGPSITFSSTFQNDTSLTVASNQMLTVTGGLVNQGSLTLAGGTIGGALPFTNNAGGVVTAYGTINSQLVNHGTLDVDGTLLLTSSPATNDGVIQGVGTVTASSQFNNSAGGVINAATPGGTLSIFNLSINAVSATMNVGPSSTLSITSNAWTNAGLINLQGAGSRLSGGTLTNMGLIQGFGTITSAISSSGNGGMFRASGGELDFTATSVSLSPTLQLQVTAGATAMFLNGVTSSTGTISITGGTFDTNLRTFTNNGTINGYGTIRTGAITNASGKLISIGEGNMDVFGNFTNNGVVNIQTGRSAYFYGTVNGAGSFTGGGTAVFLNSLSPGNSPALLNIAGGASLVGGTLTMELGGTTAGTQYDQLHVGGALSIGGALTVSRLNGFTPAVGSSFDLLDWGTLSGTFSSLSLPTLTTGQWDTSQLYTTGVLSVIPSALAGDYNHNGVVDAADYVAWRHGLGTTYTQTDYDVWRANFGNTAASGSGSQFASGQAAVPELGTGVLALVGALGLALSRRSR